MGSIGAPELIVIALIALLLFGAGRIADIGKGLGQGIKNFKQGMADDAAEEVADTSKTVEHQATETVEAAKTKAKAKKS